MPEVTLGNTAAADLSSQGRTAWQNQLVHDLLAQLIKAQRDRYTPLPSRYAVDPRGNPLPIKERDILEQTILNRLAQRQGDMRQMANVEREMEAPRKLSEYGEFRKKAIKSSFPDLIKLAHTLTDDPDVLKRVKTSSQLDALNIIEKLAQQHYGTSNIHETQPVGTSYPKEIQKQMHAYLNPISDLANLAVLSSKVSGLNPLQAKLEATKMKKLAGLPVTGVVDSEFEKMNPMQAKLAIGKYERQFRENFTPQLEKYITPPEVDFSEFNEKTPGQLRSLAIKYKRASGGDNDTSEFNTMNNAQLRAAGINYKRKMPPIGPSELQPSIQEDPLVQQAVRDDYNISKDAIKSIMESNPEKREVFLNKLEQGGADILPRANQISEYLGYRSRGTANAMLDQMTENYLTNILPQGNLGFMKGAWNSPQRGSHQTALLRNMSRDVANQLMKMEESQARLGLSEAAEEQKRELYSGQLGTEALNKSLEAQTRAAYGLSDIERIKGAEEMGYLEALGKIGQEKRQAEENILLEKQKQALTERERPREMALEALQATQGLPTQTLSDVIVQQQQPNYAAQVGYGLGNFATAMNLARQGGSTPFKKGGLVQKFADGGMPVNQDNYQQLLDQEAQNLINTETQDISPLTGAVAKMTDALAERYTGMPAIAGTMVESYQKHGQQQQARRQQGLNLIQSLHTARIKQQEFLAEMDYKNRHLGETSRHNQAIEDIQREQKSKKLTQADQEILKSSNKALSGSENLLEDLDKADGLLEKIDTGNWSNQQSYLKTPWVQGMIGKGEQADYDEFDKIYDDFANKAALTYGAKAGARVIEYLRKAKPHRGMAPDAIRNINENLRHMIEEEQQKAFYVNESLEKGIAPTTALSEFVKSASEKRKSGKSPEQTEKAESTDISQTSSAELRKIAGLE